MSRLQQSHLLRPKKNCCKIAHSGRVGVLIDASNYYRALHETLLRAENQVLILGWDTDSRVKLLQDDPQCLPFGEFLSQLLKQKPNLKIHILSWDYAFIYAFEREALPKFKFKMTADSRLEFILDNNHPLGASQHQKIVVIDDEVAFSGGLDITGRRWDTQEHQGIDERRVDPGGGNYAPFHDVQIAVTGEAAKSLGDIARERWRVATGVSLIRPMVGSSIWFNSAELEFRNVKVGISRTLPANQGRRPVYEVKKLFQDMIAAARNCIYIENQYFTSDEIAKCLAKRLEEPNGPEIVLVLPRDNSGWLEENTMGILRARALKILCESDRFKRLRVMYPIVPQLPEDKFLNVHSKVMIIDDSILRIGSANLSQRSMGFDSECDITISAEVNQLSAELTKSIRLIRATLLAEHLGSTVEQIENILHESHSLISVVDRLRGGPRTLADLSWQIPAWVDRLLPEAELIDPPRPYRPLKIIRKWISDLFEPKKPKTKEVYG